MEEEITIRLRGQGVSPGLIRSKEIAEILESIEDMVIAEAIKFDPSLVKEDIIVGLYEIEDKSIGLKFKTTLSSIVVPVFIATAQAVSAGNFDSLSPQTIKSLQSISSFSKRHSSDALLGPSLENPITIITPDTIIPTPVHIIGSSEILGKVIRVGGKKPKAMIELANGSIIYCDVEEQIAKDLGHQLYSTARFYGLAKWDSQTLELEEFQISSVEEFKNRDANSMLKEFGSVLGDEISIFEDVDQFIRSIRLGEDF